MDKYTLFLDECNDKEKGYILVSGFAIPNNQLELFGQKIKEIKEIFWSKEYIDSHQTVLHCTELSVIHNNRKNRELYKYITRDEYNFFRRLSSSEIKDLYNRLYIKLSEVMKNFDITIFGCLIDKNRLDYIFDETSRKILEDPYNIAIQVIIENFTHFLNKRNGVGYIIYEARNAETNVSRNSLDMNMYDNFCKIKVVSKGLPYVNTNAITNRIRYFNIIRKTEENPGIEYADFITYNLFKSFFINDENDKSEFIKKVEKNIYKGELSEGEKDLSNFFGVRHIPEDFCAVDDLSKQLDKLKRAHKKLKKERDKLIEKNAILRREKEELKSKINQSME